MLPLGTYTFDEDGKMVNPPTDAAVGTVVNASYAKSSAISLGYVFDEADTTVYQYHYVGDTLAGLTCGTDELYFTYDVLGPSAVIYNGTTYYYTRNAQGDITGIVNASGTQVVAYTYDAWGNPLATTGAMASTLGELNPLRYRGYVYDSETGLYYLQSRYYNPGWGRFINADSAIADVGEHPLGYNLFAYCANNPVNMSDDSGYWPSWATKLVIGTAIIAIAAILTVATAGTGTALACFAVGALKGAAVGAAVGAATGAASGAVNHRITTGSWEGADQAALEGAADGYMMGAATGFISGGLTSNVCFVAGTSVLTSFGYTVIEDITIGDLVWAANPETGEIALKPVVQTFVNETNELVHVHVNGEKIVCTPEHPFYSPVKGWTSAIHLRAGDILVTVNGEYVIVEQVQHEILENKITVYNFEVQDYHTYYVTNVGVLVHNVCNGNTSAAQRGKAMHKNWDYGQNGKTIFKEYSISGVGRADAVDFGNRIVYELKPNNHRAIRQEQYAWLRAKTEARKLLKDFAGKLEASDVQKIAAIINHDETHDFFRNACGGSKHAIAFSDACRYLKGKGYCPEIIFDENEIDIKVVMGSDVFWGTLHISESIKDRRVQTAVLRERFKKYRPYGLFVFIPSTETMCFYQIDLDAIDWSKKQCKLSAYALL